MALPSGKCERVASIFSLLYHFGEGAMGMLAGRRDSLSGRAAALRLSMRKWRQKPQLSENREEKGLASRYRADKGRDGVDLSDVFTDGRTTGRWRPAGWRAIKVMATAVRPVQRSRREGDRS